MWLYDLVIMFKAAVKCQSLQKTSARQPWGMGTGGKGFPNKAYLNVHAEMLNGCPPCCLPALVFLCQGDKERIPPRKSLS